MTPVGWGERLEHAGPWLISAGLALSTLLNQHRLQPWTWHIFLLCPLTAIRSGPAGRHRPESAIHFTFTTVTILTASIYIFSGISKLDAGFSATYGQQLTESLLGAVGISTRFWPESTQTLVARSLPLGELAIGILLLMRRWSLGFPLSILMHFLLLLALGPLGMQHRPGVLIWNTCFIIQNLILWRCSRLLHQANPSDTRDRAETPRSTTRFSTRLHQTPRAVALSLLLFAVSFPVLRVFGLCDPWPAWAVYASQPARVTILADDTAAATLPTELQALLQPRRLDDGQTFVRIDLWSIEATGAPVCPGDRFSVAVARTLSEHTAGQGHISLVVEGPAGWMDQKRISQRYSGTQDITEFAETFRINTRSRKRP